MKFSPAEKFLLFVAAAVNFTHLMDFVIMMPLGPILIRAFQINAQQFGLLVSSYSFAAAITGLLASLVVDRFDRKACLLVLFGGFAVGTLGCALAPTYTTLLVARAVTGAFGGVISSLVYSMISDAIAYERRGSAMGVVMGSFSVASTLGVPFGLLLANKIEWHAPFFFLALLSAPLWLLIAWRLPPMRAHLHTGMRRSVLDSFRQVATHRPQQAALVFIFSLVLGQFSIIPYLSQSFVSNAGLKESELPLIYFFGGLCSMFASPVAGRLADRYTKQRVFMISALLSITPILLITNLGPHPSWMLLVLSSSFFIVMSGRMVPAMAMVSAAAKPEFRGGFMSIANSVQNFSAALAAYVAGQIVVYEGNHFYHYNRVGLIAVLFSFAALALSRWLPREQS